MKDIRVQSTLDLLQFNRKQTARYMLLYFALPIVYFFFETKSIEELDFGIISLSPSDLLNALFPIFYILILFYMDYLKRSANEALILLENDAYELLSKDKQEERWLQLISVNGALRNTLDVFNNKNYSSLLFTIPFFLCFYGYLIVFLAYSLDNLFAKAQQSADFFLWILFVLNIWLLAGYIVFRVESYKREKRAKKSR